MALRCPRCGSEWVDKLSRCPICGADAVGYVPETRPRSRKCHICTQVNDIDATYCIKCGSNLRGEDYARPTDEESTAAAEPLPAVRPAWLAGFLKGFDIDRDQWKASLVIGMIIFTLLSILLIAADDVCCSSFFLVMLVAAALFYWMSFGRDWPGS